MESPEHSLYFIEGLDFEQKREEIRICYTSKQFEDSKCAHLCHVRFNEFVIPMKFIANYKQALYSIPYNLQLSLKKSTIAVLYSFIKRKKMKKYFLKEMNTLLTLSSAFQDHSPINTTLISQIFYSQAEKSFFQ
jgi:hypothetical protein